jgi:hypothetical protein
LLEFVSRNWGGEASRTVKIELAPFLSLAQYERSHIEPINFASNEAVAILLFKDRFLYASGHL